MQNKLWFLDSNKTNSLHICELYFPDMFQYEHVQAVSWHSTDRFMGLAFNSYLGGVDSHGYNVNS